MLKPTLLLSLHDVTPCHERRLARAEALFQELGVTRVTYLLVPRYHDAWQIDEDPEFVTWCHRPRPFTVQWCLHGWYHLETRQTAGGSPANWFKRRLLTAGESEFLDLQASELQRRIDRGRALFRSCFSVEPSGFVAPAWLFNRSLIPALLDRGFSWTEDHRRLYDLRSNRVIDAPAITWAARTLVRRCGSMWLPPALLRLWRARPVIRIAVHPLDFDHARLIEAIKCTISVAARSRVFRTYDEVLGRAGQACIDANERGHT